MICSYYGCRTCYGNFIDNSDYPQCPDCGEKENVDFLGDYDLPITLDDIPEIDNE